MKITKFKKGDLVYYNDYIEETFAKSDKQLGVIVHVYENVSPLFSYMKEEIFPLWEISNKNIRRKECEMNVSMHGQRHFLVPKKNTRIK